MGTLCRFDHIFTAERFERASPQCQEEQNDAGEGSFPNFASTLHHWGLEEVKGSNRGQACLVWTAPAYLAVQAEGEGFFFFLTVILLLPSLWTF